MADATCKRRGAQAVKPEPGLRDQQMVPSAAAQAPEAFMLKDKGYVSQALTGGIVVYLVRSWVAAESGFGVTGRAGEPQDAPMP